MSSKHHYKLVLLCYIISCLNAERLNTNSLRGNRIVSYTHVVLDNYKEDINLVDSNNYNFDFNRRLRNSKFLPSSKNIVVTCHNSTSNCGKHGKCIVSNNNKICHCNEGYYTISLDKPCESKGKSQTLVAILWYTLGWSGVSAFILGWTAFGVSILLTCCCGVSCITLSYNNRQVYSKSSKMVRILFGIICLCICLCLWIYGIIVVSSDYCMSKNGTPCNSW